MSVVSSVKTNFCSVSEMSLGGSSALVTAASTYTFSDCDYETSSELLSPRVPSRNNSQISRCSSSHRHSKNGNYVIASQSSSMLLDKSKESTTSFEENKCLLKIKSDTCLSQQSQIISDFMNDIFKVQQQYSAETNLTNKDSSDSIGTEFTLARGDETPPMSQIDFKFSSSTNLFAEYGPRPNKVTEHFLNENFKDSKSSSARKNTSSREKPLIATLSKTKYKIFENLSQVTCDKLFSKPSSRYFEPNVNELTSTTSTSTDRCLGEPLASRTPSKRSQLSRRSVRSSGVESILRIDYELQPLNLMLSRLLAEFRAMDLKGKLGYIDPSIYNFTTFCGPHRKLILPEVKSFESSNRCYDMFSTAKDWTTMMDKEPQKNSTSKNDKELQFLWSKEFAKALSASHERLDEARMTLREKSNTQSSRSCESNRPIYENLVKQRYESRLRKSEKRDARVRYCKLHGRNGHLHQHHHRNQSSHQETRYQAAEQMEPIKRGIGDDFGRKILDEITSMNLRCIEATRGCGDNKKDPPPRSDLMNDADDTDDDDDNMDSSSKRKAPVKKIENESSKLHHLQSEETEVSSNDGVAGSFSCPGLISPAKNYAFLMPPPASTNDVSGSSSVDSLSNDNDATARIRPLLQSRCALP